MFQIAAGYAHCRRNGFNLILSPYGCRYWDSYLHNFAKMTGKPIPGVRCWREPRFCYVPIPPDARNLTGYFQSSKYFADVSDEIRTMFDLPEHNKEAATARHTDILTPELLANGVVLHIRRGDYLRGDNLPIHGILDERYYRRAIAAAQAAIPACRFLVFSDDLAWCKQQTWLTDVGAIFVDETIDYMALWIMSRFRIFILANSTFSWWAAWLSDAKTRGGYVWAPDRWFGRAGPQDFNDIYEPEWVKLPID